MKRLAIGMAAFLGLAFVVTGCGKKAQDQANLSGTGFDSLSTTEELSQLPQASAQNAQQSSVEVLPIEAAPVTQAANAASPAISSAQSATLSYQQKIQTALKNAGLYTGNIDGKIGPGTRKAIETFQKNNGLKADGKVGPKTWAALEPYFNGQAQAQTQAAAPAETPAQQ
jgi:peptidoglycan hydrolase-like protein with peptidoglycan-binding domain